MGGTGGGYFYSNTNPEDIRRKIQKEKDNAQDQQFDSKIRAYLNDLLSRINSRDNDDIQKKLNAISNALESDIDGTLDLRYGGSVAKHTYVDGLSDIDSLALINNTELIGKSPEVVKDYFYNRLLQRYPNTEIKKGDLAVTIKFSNGKEIQILPAIKTATGFKIAQLGTNNWSNVVNPKRFALMLRASNQQNAGKVVPTIKLVKSIVAGLSEKRRISGYHTEALAIDVFAGYRGEKNLKSMVKHFFNEAASRVLKPIQDKSGQSTHVDDYLGSHNSINRKMVSDSFSNIGRKLEKADLSKIDKVWHEMLS